MKLLVVEDDRLLNNTLCYNLSAAGYAVDSAMTKATATHLCEKQDYDLTRIIHGATVKIIPRLQVDSLDNSV